MPGIAGGLRGCVGPRLSSTRSRPTDPARRGVRRHGFDRSRFPAAPGPSATRETPCVCDEASADTPSKEVPPNLRSRAGKSSGRTFVVERSVRVLPKNTSAAA
jgi:hypothetical protein